MGLLRYKYSNIEDFLKEISICKEIRINLVNLKRELNERNFLVIYLSRIGIVEKYQEMRISQIIINFFEYLIQKKKINTTIFVKVVKEIVKVIGPSYDIIAENYDEKWGSYYLGAKIIEVKKN